MDLNAAALPLIELALQEDISSGDVTSLATIPEDCVLEAVVIARQKLTVCGLAVAKQVFSKVDPSLSFETAVEEGTDASPEMVLCRIRGAGRSILSAERTALNFMQRLSGIATLTADMKRRANNPAVLLRDTRKTTPGWRVLEKHAVLTGGGSNHRMGLYDAFLIKNNHVDAVGGDIAEAIRRCRRYSEAGLRLQVEVRDERELRSALAERPDSILLDNMSPDELARLVKIVREEIGNTEVELEASGGVNQETIARIAQTGVDAISVGMLTHSATAADISLRYVDSMS